MIINVYGDISPRTAAFAAVEFLERAVPYLVIEKFGQAKPLPANSTKTMTWRRYNALDATPNVLVEGVTPTGKQLTTTDVSVTLEQLGDRVTVGHAAVVHGATVEDHCLVGIGARALNGSHMGEGSWLAAGAVLAEGKSIPPWTIAVGIPAKPFRELTARERERQAEGVDHYVGFGSTYGRLLGVFNSA